MSIYFSKNDPLGATSNLALNFENHGNRKTHHGSWGSDDHTRKLLPRGKAYDKMWTLQFDCYAKKFLGC